MPSLSVDASAESSASPVVLLSAGGSTVLFSVSAEADDDVSSALSGDVDESLALSAGAVVDSLLSASVVVSAVSEPPLSGNESSSFKF